MTKIAVALIIKNNDSVLLQRRCNTGYEDGMYSCIGGHKEENEEVLEAIIRETKEELGIEVNKKDIHFLQVLHRKLSNRDYIDFIFWTDKWVGEPIIMEKNKSDELSWYRKDNLPSNITPFIKDVLVDFFSNKAEPFKSIDWDA